MAPSRKARVLIIAGSDSGAGAGIQADLKTALALGTYATTAITALTAQNTQGVFGIHEVPPPFIRQQMELVLSDIGTDAVKTGMLHSAEVIRTVAETLKQQAANAPLVVDPVMVAKGGAPLLQPQAVAALKESLLPLAAVATPNIPEAELLSGLSITTQEDMRKAAHAIRRFGAKAVLIKGGHLPGDVLIDFLLTEDQEKIFSNQRVDSKHTHGTGCTLASAIACGLAAGLPMEESVRRAREYVQQAIRQAPALGKGHGPLEHGWPLAAHTPA